jgi:competence protein ComEA
MLGASLVGGACHEEVAFLLPLYPTRLWGLGSLGVVLGGDGSRATVAIWVAAALLGGLALLQLVGGRGAEGGAPVRIDRPPASGASGARGGPSGGGIYVHVAGAVRQPGLLHLDDGARIAEAIDRAGGPGPRADLAGVNLAARLEDGQQVIVPVRGAGAAPASPAPATGSAPPPGTAGVPKVSLGAATVEQLDQVDGIGPTLAQRIVQYRTEHGGFRSLAELREVEGIGEKRFEGLREALGP